MEVREMLLVVAGPVANTSPEVVGEVAVDILPEHMLLAHLLVEQLFRWLLVVVAWVV
jgi:hypothetical protein